MAGRSKRFQFRLDARSGVPVYRQLIDQVLIGIASGSLTSGTQLPTVRQVAVDLAINPNTVVRAYKELEGKGMLGIQQGSGTFITGKKIRQDDSVRQKRLTQMVGEFLARTAADGWTIDDVLQTVAQFQEER